MLKYIEEKGARKYSVDEEEQTKGLEAREKAAKAATSGANDRAELYREPLAGLELYGVTYRAKGSSERPTEKKLTRQSETTRIDDKRETAEFEEGIEMTRRSTQMVTREIREGFAEMPDKSVRTNLEKFTGRCERSEKTPPRKTAGEISQAAGAEGRLEKWINKRKHRKTR